MVRHDPIFLWSKRCQFALFFFEFEWHGLECHKNNIVAVAEATFEFSRILPLVNDPSKEDSNPFQLQIGLANGAQLVLTSIYNEKHSRLVYIRHEIIFSFNFHTQDHEHDIKNAHK